MAITLAIAEHLRATPPARDVLVAFFDAEEPPYFLSQAMGSVRFVLDQMDAPRRGLCALIQDLTGHDVSLPLPVVGQRGFAQDQELALHDRSREPPASRRRCAWLRESN